jgi:hypothetical protein
MAGKLLVPSEVDPQNIARPNVEQTSAEEPKALAEVRRKICEQKEREILELEEEAMAQYISHVSEDRQGNVKKDKDVVSNIHVLKVQSDASPKDNSDFVNMIDGAVSTSLNNKFVAMSEKFESTINSNLDRIEDKFGKQLSSNDINASKSNTENSKDSMLDDFLDLHIPKVPIGIPPIHHMHSRATIGASAGGGSTMAATNAMMSHTVVYSEPSACVPNSLLQHVPNTLPNQTLRVERVDPHRVLHRYGVPDNLKDIHQPHNKNIPLPPGELPQRRPAMRFLIPAGNRFFPTPWPQPPCTSAGEIRRSSQLALRRRARVPPCASSPPPAAASSPRLGLSLDLLVPASVRSNEVAAPHVLANWQLALQADLIWLVAWPMRGCRRGRTALAIISFLVVLGQLYGMGGDGEARRR